MRELQVLPFNAIDKVCMLDKKPHRFRVVQPDTLISGTDVRINGRAYRVLSTSKFPDVEGTRGQLVVRCKPIKEPHAGN